MGASLLWGTNCHNVDLQVRVCWLTKTSLLPKSNPSISSTNQACLASDFHRAAKICWAWVCAMRPL